MSRESILASMRQLRRDWGEMLFHFTRAQGETQPFDVLLSILEEGTLRGSNGYIRGNYNCVCFTEAPIAELAAIFELNEETEREDRPRYSPYGVAVSKDWLFARGGRPVIYQTDSEYNQLPDSLRHRHVRYDPQNGIDFTWEREWRYRGDRLELDPMRTVVVVKNAAEASLVMDLYKGWEYTMTRDINLTGVGERSGVRITRESNHSFPRWMTVSLDLFGFSLLRPEH